MPSPHPQSRLDLGVGMVVVPGCEVLWEQVENLVEVVEVEPQAFWARTAAGGWQLHEPSYRWLDSLRQPVISHSVSCAVGGTVAPDPALVGLAAASTARLGARHWSEHLSFNRCADPSSEGGHMEACFLLPPMQTWAGVEAAVEGAGALEASLDLPFLVETPVNYLRPVTGDLDDGRFVAEVAGRADCGILLDLHNVWANARNGRQPLDDYLDQLPLERVLEVHLAGGMLHAGYWLDAHCGAVAPELLDIAAQVIPRLPNLRAVIFEAMPDAIGALGPDGLRAALTDVHRTVESSALPATAGRRDTAHRDSSSKTCAPVQVFDERSTTEGRERDLVAHTTHRPTTTELADPGADLLRHLTDQARLSLVVADRPDEVRALLSSYGATVAEEVGAAFLRLFPARLMDGDAGAEFAVWWREFLRSGVSGVGGAAPSSGARNGAGSNLTNPSTPTLSPRRSKP